MTNPRDPQLWWPGVVYVTPPGDVMLGRSVGYATHTDALRDSICGRRSALAYWTHTAWLVPRAALGEELVADHGITLPEALIDSSRQRYAHRWLAEQPFVAVSGTTWPRLTADGAPGYRVAFDATGDRVFRVDAYRDGAIESALAFRVPSLSPRAADSMASLDHDGDPSTIDRALRWLSAGTLDEAAVLNAFDARRLIEDGYGYREALEGELESMSKIADEVALLDQVYRQVFARAGAMQPDAEAFVECLNAAASDATEVGTPLYGAARRITIAPLAVPHLERLVLAEREEPELLLPGESRWSVGPVEAFRPALPKTLNRSTRVR
ncbi:MAG: hypothetical protein R3B72_32180 [Polyangiaceae bacterium]